MPDDAMPDPPIRALPRPARAPRQARRTAADAPSLFGDEAVRPSDAPDAAAVDPDAERGEDPSADLARRRALARTVHERLCAAYSCPIAFFSGKDPLSELVSALLSHRTKNADSSRAFRTLVARFPTWEAVTDADVRDVEEAIAAATWPEQKAPRIQDVLRRIAARTLAEGHRREGEPLSLDFLAADPSGADPSGADRPGAMSVEDARAWLEAMPGVGPKTSAAVLLFSRLRRPAMPVDSHHHRVAERLGLLPPGTAVGPAHRLLDALRPDDWDAQAVYDHHEGFMLHGQRVCTHAAPKCPACVLLDVCPTGQRRTGQQRTAERPPAQK